jgi:uncharacterized protein YxjI
MREKLVTIGDDFWIEDEHGQKAFKVDGKALRVRDTLNFENPHGHVLCKIQERMLRVKDSMEVGGADGKQVAMVKKAIISPVRDRFTVKIKNGPDLDVQGNIVDHEYKIGEGRDKVAMEGALETTETDVEVIETAEAIIDAAYFDTAAALVEAELIAEADKEAAAASIKRAMKMD